MFLDHQLLQSIDHVDPRRLQRMFVRIQRYCVDSIYKPGKGFGLADTLSRGQPPETEENNYGIETVHRVEVMSATGSRMERMREE